MAKTPKKPKLDHAGLTVLGLDRLVGIALDEAALNPSFKKRLSAALAGFGGGAAVGKLVDSRLDALEKARTRIKGQRERLFGKELESLLATIGKEFGAVDPGMALERLVRFVAGYEGIAERANDASGRIAKIYVQACDEAGRLAALLPPADALRVPDIVNPGLKGFDYHGFSTLLAMRIAAALPPEALKAWDDTLIPLTTVPQKSPFLPAVVMVRRAIAGLRGDLDTDMAIEAALPEDLREPLLLAERLFAAGRYKEALEWVRRPRRARVGFMKRADLYGGTVPTQPDAARLEAAILDCMKDRAGSQDVRWRIFEERLDAAILRDYIAKAGDFEEFEALDRAFAFVERHPDVNGALSFYLDWPRLDLAARYVVRRADIWDGRFSDTLASSAERLQEEHPAAATILYRAIVDHTLTAGLSEGYEEAVVYMGRLAALAAEPGACDGIASHEAYLAHLRRTQGRRFGFWNQLG